MKKNVIAMILMAGMAASVMAGCASSGEETKSAGTDTPAEESSQAEGAEGKVNLVFWTGLSGQPGEIIQQVVDDYNSSQDKVFVDLQYQGSYQESLNKLKTSMRTQDGPDLVQIYEAGTRIMIDSGFVIPMQQIIDEYEIDVSGLEENMLNYYTVDGQLYSMPLNTSVPVCYYNKTALSQIGYENGPETWDDIVDMCCQDCSPCRTTCMSARSLRGPATFRRCVISRCPVFRPRCFFCWLSTPSTRFRYSRRLS